MHDPNREEALRRVREACSLIEAAYRLCVLDPSATLRAVERAMIDGAQAAVEDVREEVERALRC